VNNTYNPNSLKSPMSKTPKTPKSPIYRGNFEKKDQGSDEISDESIPELEYNFFDFTPSSSYFYDRLKYIA
jgi:hypothetical protein